MGHQRGAGRGGERQQILDRCVRVVLGGNGLGEETTSPSHFLSIELAGGKRAYGCFLSVKRVSGGESLVPPFLFACLSLFTSPRSGLSHASIKRTDWLCLTSPPPLLTPSSLPTSFPLSSRATEKSEVTEDEAYIGAM